MSPNRYYANRNKEREDAGQVTIDHALDLAWQHARDCELNHEQCPGDLLIVRKTPLTMESSCVSCGLVVVSTLTSLLVQRG